LPPPPPARSGSFSPSLFKDYEKIAFDWSTNLTDMLLVAPFSSPMLDFSAASPTHIKPPITG